VTIAWEPASRNGGPTPARVDVERLNPDGSSLGPMQQIPKGDPTTGRAMAKFAMEPGTTILRFTSIDAHDEVLDRWTQDVNVPELEGAALALATPRFLLARSPFEFRALQSPDTPPSASRRLRKSDRLLVEIEAYARGGTPELSVDLLNQKGESLVTLPVPAPSASGKARVEVPLQSLAPATYVLKITAKTAEKRAEHHSPFRIVP
jgi:hypothetical protein